MTFILGWQDADDVFIIADSAMSHSSLSKTSMTSFGEATNNDKLTVEERAIKILEIPRGAAAICGDVVLALDFIESVSMRLKYGDRKLAEFAREVAESADLSHGFKILFGYVEDGRPRLIAFDSESRLVEDVGPRRCAVFGSLPRPKKELAGRILCAIRDHGLAPDGRLAAGLVALQAIGITDYLLQHGVGGAFFGVHVDSAGVKWQPDLCYLIYRSGLFDGSPVVLPGEQKSPASNVADVEKVRVLVRDGAGILLSSIGAPAARVLLPPNQERSETEWEAIVLAAVPPPFFLVVGGSHMGLLSKEFSKAVYIYNPELRDRSFAITKQDGQTYIEAASPLVRTLDLPTPEGAFDLTIVTEDADGTNAKTYRISIPL